MIVKIKFVVIFVYFQLISQMRKNKVVPIIEEIPILLSPVEIFELFQFEPHSFLLESGMNIEELGRYSFIGRDPFLIFKSSGFEIELIEKTKKLKLNGNPFDFLRTILDKYNIEPVPGLPAFLAGAVGYFGYDLCHLIEKLPCSVTDDLYLPDCYLAFYDTLLIFDHLKDKIYISSCGFPETGKEGKMKALRRLEELKEDFISRYKNNRGFNEMNPLENKEQKNSLNQHDILLGDSFKSNFIRRDYLKAVERVKEYIACGDIYQVNLSQRFCVDLSISPFILYRWLQKINPAPFAGFLNFDGMSIISASPERFIRLLGRKVETRPMKGTRPRGKNPCEDEELKQELLNSEKDRAELVMIVDLERNDLGRVCEYGSVQVKELRTLETYSTVFQTTATIEGKLREDKDRIDLVKSCFPGGSITGVPKIRAMEIIDELEPTKRGIYTGSIGYLSFSGDMDLNVVIRTIISKGGKAYFQVGGGIVSDSYPEGEYEETLYKAKALIEAVKGCSSVQPDSND